MLLFNTLGLCEQQCFVCLAHGCCGEDINARVRCVRWAKASLSGRLPIDSLSTPKPVEIA